LRPRDVKAVPERVEQGASRLDRAGALFTVHLERDLDLAGEDLRPFFGGLGLVEREGRGSGQDGRRRREPGAPEEVAAAVSVRTALVFGIVFWHRFIPPLPRMRGPGRLPATKPMHYVR